MCLSPDCTSLSQSQTCHTWYQSKMKFDNVISEINGFGKFQIRLVLIQMLSRCTMPCNFLLNNFMAAVPSHHCNIAGLDDGAAFGNFTMEQKLAVGVPAERDGRPSSCLMFSKPQHQQLSGWNSSEDMLTLQNSDSATVECRDGWVYDNSTFKSTLVTEVCVQSLHVMCAVRSCVLQRHYQHLYLQ